MAIFFKENGFEVASMRDIEPHEVILDNLAKKKEEEIGISERKIETPLLKTIFNRFLLFSFLVISVLFWRVFQLQIVEGGDFLAKANENRYILSKIQAGRGVIYDRNLEQLVFNIPSFNLICQKNNLPDYKTEKEKVVKEVSQILNIEYEFLWEKIEGSKEQIVVVSENLDHQILIILETKIEELLGFRIEQNSIRDYEDGDNFSHLIGYVGKISNKEWKAEPEYYSFSDSIGRTGIEKYYEEALRKNPGKVKIERDVLGNIISKEIIELPKSGKSLVLWLDSKLQKKTKEELEKQLKIIGSKKAIAIALDPKTGGVLTLVSIPSFDNNIFSKGDSESIKRLLKDPDESLFDRAISGHYLTGSTIKPLIASAVLEEKIINPDKKMNCQGLIEVKHKYDTGTTKYHDWRTHGWTDMRKAIAESCNVYFYTVGGGYGNQEGLGPTRIGKYLELFGWGEKTQIDLPEEAVGFIPDKEWKKRVWGQGWWDGDTYNLSIGQGYLLITPLEVVNSFLAIANGGKLFQPRVVQKIIDGQKNTVEEIQPKILRENFIDPKNLQIVREGMRQAVTGENSPHASAVLLNSLPVKAAAKTGTAETPIEGIYHNWVTVFAPYEDPEIVLTIMIEDVKEIRPAVLPVAKEILNWYFTR